MKINIVALSCIAFAIAATLIAATAPPPPRSNEDPALRAQAEGLKAQADALKSQPGKAKAQPSNYALPNPSGHAGEYLISDGTKYVFTKVAPAVAGVSVKTDALTGESVSFVVTASGTGPFTYQWVKNGAQIPVTTPTLTIPNTKLTDAGTYSCMVRGAAGSVASKNYTLAVR